ncbi:OVARIAN TUMOR DOMAIN-containing deubiquitinating enzyme 7-like [Dioscorea cayenensis subsp. rotundata]|uniref:OVARIAN TUMOR DOMAIN-containing deubiquitinating enzyme 7-like n=1 Tax=Dioscorea cayennensis subsp. rotundata TaxID=55577 RepID=A0AB40BL49_DIOCR|nr:OVARIAN TUMOR DOMAIN-containing deubiquitinating enzyme 7-like [Dioscorea cayenensis subsp. rotundata]
MIQSKQKKPQPEKKQSNVAAVKKKGKEVDLPQFRPQLNALGLKIIQITADGNCFFRALADQLEGNEEEHIKYRHMVVKYILNHREDFEPFIEGDVPFDKYCHSMGKQGTWAGHMELQAASLVTGVNICIHRAMFPRWYIRNFQGQEARMIHLSYHHGKHYNSVRLREDSCEGPARQIIIKADSDILVPSHNKKVSSCLPKAASVKMVMSGTGCENFDKAEQVLQEFGGDVDAAIEYLIAEQETKDCENDDNDIPSENNISNGNFPSEDVTIAQSSLDSDSQSVTEHKVQVVDKKTSNNKQCSCGSKKRYKACCGSGVASTSAVTNSNAKCTSSKDRKDRKSCRRKEAVGEAEESRSSNQLDLSALCL